MICTGTLFSGRKQPIAIHSDLTPGFIFNAETGKLATNLFLLP